MDFVNSGLPGDSAALCHSIIPCLINPLVWVTWQYAEWWGHGLRCIHPIARLRVSTTGKEGMSIHVYANLRFAPAS